ncbi:MAG: hypothetical protein ACOCUR_01460, partial [Nanoarchaeota archaeon]
MMDINPVKQYYEENVRKGYTVDQVTNNLKNSGYTDDVLYSAKSALGKDVLDLSTKNASMFDYSKLPGNLKNKIQPSPQQGFPQNPQQASVQNSQQFPVQNPSPAVEKHPGLDKDSMIKYGSIVGGVLLVIIIASIIFAISGNDMSRDASSGRTDVGTGLDDEVDAPDYEQNPYEEQEEDSLYDDEPVYNETNVESDTHDDENQSIAVNESSHNLTEEVEDDTEEDEQLSGKFCELDEDCFDGDLLTIRYCDDDNRCGLKLDDGRECISGDEFCPPRCYGYDVGDEDCVDDKGRNLCETNDHCDDGDEWTEGKCRSGVCLMFDIEKPNNPPTITSTPVNKTLAYELYEYQVIAEDEDNDTITFSLKNAPS